MAAQHCLLQLLLEQKEGNVKDLILIYLRQVEQEISLRGVMGMCKAAQRGKKIPTAAGLLKAALSKASSSLSAALDFISHDLPQLCLIPKGQS